MADTEKSERVAVVGYDSVPVGDLKPFGKNPRRGNVDAIAESLDENGQYRPLVVNKRDMTILAGNHTWRAAKKLKWDTIEVAYVDVDAAQAKKIMLADNRTNDLATYDTNVLRQILAEIPDHVGTGYSEDERNMLIAVTEDTHDIDAIVDVLQPMEPKWNIPESLDDYDFDDTDEAEVKTAGKKMAGVSRPDPEQDDVIRSLDAVSSDLEGILELKETLVFPIENYWGIPKLGNRFVEELPDKIITWAGSKVTPDDGESTYIYNYGVDSAKDLPWDRAILSFYTHDIHFENWWRLPAHYVSKVINAGIKYAITPNFSQFSNDPRVIHIWNVYRTRWLGRYLQEAGIQIIPDVTYPDMEGLEQYSLVGIPKGTPTIAMQVQTVRRHDTKKIEEDTALITRALEIIEPRNVIVYGGKTGHRMFSEIPGVDQFNVVYQDNRATMRRGVVFDESKGYNITKDGKKAEEVEEAEDVIEEEEGVQAQEGHRGGVPHDKRVTSL